MFSGFTLVDLSLRLFSSVNRFLI
uniref:Uncharacterized protein n=1 Tax=Lepeophtheirus salmonis TaxID=72036 RepID=A0A0K2V812_LEPSM